MTLSLDRWIGMVAVVTGASSGIGAAIAEELVDKGLIVAALARRQERLEELARRLESKKGQLIPIKADVTKEEDIKNAFSWIETNLGPVHILVNAAGVYHKGLLIDGDAKEWNDTFQVNVLGLSIATREAIRSMRDNNVNGHIIHINSIVGHQTIPIPGSNVYSPSKFAVTALAETLRQELNHLKLDIKVTSISPGLIDTDIIPEQFRQPETKDKLYAEKKIIEPYNIADSVLYVLSTPPHVQIQELTISPLHDIS